MYYEIQLATPIHAIALSTSAIGEKTEISDTGFYSDANSEFFYAVLEEFESLFLQPFVDAARPTSTIDNYLVLIDNQKAQVFINQAKRNLQTIVKRTYDANQSLTLEDIVGVMSLSFPEVVIADNMGIIFFFTIGWKRGVFYDLRTNVINKAQDNSYSLGIFYEYLLYSHIYSLDDEIWTKAYNHGWFPFISLLGDAEPQLKYLLQRIVENKSINDAENAIVEFFTEEKLAQILTRIQENPDMNAHIKTIERSVERYLAGDYISTTNNIWPRIEGVLRYIYSETKSNDPKAKQLLDEVEDFVFNRTESPTIFLPHKFKDYLSLFFYDKFDLPNGKLNISRNSVAHGVADEAFYDRKVALLGLLMIDQLSFYLMRKIVS